MGNPLGRKGLILGFFSIVCWPHAYVSWNLKSLHLPYIMLTRKKLGFSGYAGLCITFFFVFHSNVINPETKQKTKVQKSLDSYEMTSGFVWLRTNQPRHTALFCHKLPFSSQSSTQQLYMTTKNRTFVTIREALTLALRLLFRRPILYQVLFLGITEQPQS